MAKKLVIDQDLCIGDGICETICPDAFEIRDDGLAYVTEEEPSDDIMDSVKEAIEACPVECIFLED